MLNCQFLDILQIPRFSPAVTLRMPGTRQIPVAGCMMLEKVSSTLTRLASHSMGRSKRLIHSQCNGLVMTLGPVWGINALDLAKLEVDQIRWWWADRTLGDWVLGCRLHWILFLGWDRVLVRGELGVESESRVSEQESILGVMGGSQSLCYPVKIGSAQVLGIWTLDLGLTIKRQCVFCI